MMKKELTIEDSPFYVDYGLPEKQQSFKASKKFENAFKKHLQDKYADEVKKDGKFKYGKYVRKVLEDYLQEQCLERKMFGKSIYAIVDEDKLKNHENNNTFFLDPLFATKPSSYYTKDFNVYDLLFYQVHKVPIDDFQHELMMWNHKQENIYLKELKKQLDDNSSANLQVLEIQLNNYLDYYHDGIYSEMANGNVHDGANIIPTSNGSFGLWYSWIVDHDYSIKVQSMQVVNQRTLLHMLNQCGNTKIHDVYASYFKHHNKNFPKLEIDILKNQLKTKVNQQRDLEDEIVELENQIRKLEDN